MQKTIKTKQTKIKKEKSTLTFKDVMLSQIPTLNVMFLKTSKELKNRESLENARLFLQDKSRCIPSGTKLITYGSVYNRYYIFCYTDGIFEYSRVSINKLRSFSIVETGNIDILVMFGEQIEDAINKPGVLTGAMLIAQKKKIKPALCVIFDSDILVKKRILFEMTLSKFVPTINYFYYIDEKDMSVSKKFEKGKKNVRL